MMSVGERNKDGMDIIICLKEKPGVRGQFWYFSRTVAYYCNIIQRYCTCTSDMMLSICRGDGCSYRIHTLRPYSMMRV